MSALVLLSCDHDYAEGTCATKAYGQPGEDIPATVARAVQVGWAPRAHPAGRHLPEQLLCPWHASGKAGGTGLL